MEASVWFDGPRIRFAADSESELEKLESSIIRGRTRQFILPLPDEPEQRLTSRFLGKVALEVLAQRLLHVPGWEAEVIDKTELDPLRKFVRSGSASTSWPYKMRSLHHEDYEHGEGNEKYQVLHEYMLLYTDENLLFLVLSLFGNEFSINFTSPDIEPYERWLEKNKGESPLYF